MERPSSERPPSVLETGGGNPTNGVIPSKGAIDSLTIIDKRTGLSYEVPTHEGAIRATELQRIKGSADGPGLFSYDPAFANTASCRSAITYIDGDRHFVPLEGRACAVQQGRGIEPGL